MSAQAKELNVPEQPSPLAETLLEIAKRTEQGKKIPGTDMHMIDVIKEFGLYVAMQHLDASMPLSLENTMIDICTYDKDKRRKLILHYQPGKGMSFGTPPQSVEQIAPVTYFPLLQIPEDKQQPIQELLGKTLDVITKLPPQIPPKLRRSRPVSY